MHQGDDQEFDKMEKTLRTQSELLMHHKQGTEGAKKRFEAMLG